MRIKSTREQRILAFKTTVRWILYYLVIFCCFIIMTSGTLLKPILLVPVALCISINNNMYASVFTGAVCGFLIDISCGKLFGYNAVILAFFCIAVSLMYELYLRQRFMNFMLINAAVSYIQCRLDYKFYYQIWEYEDVDRIFVHVSIKVWIYTIISGVFIYLIIKLINKPLMPKTHLTIEEVIKTSDRS